MGAIGGLLGTAGGASGSGFSSPGVVDITSPVTQAGINTAQGGTNQSLANSQGLLAALQQANGVGNQQAALGAGQNLYNALAGVNGSGAMGQAMGNQGGLNNALNNANGVGMQTGAYSGLQNVLGQQQATAGQLQGIANGTGPNPAQAMLNNATGANVANQAALMAGQRGAGANVGLMARQAAMQGAGIQQNAAGQSALMQAQQQLGAINQMGAQQQGMANTNQAMAGVGSGLTGAQQAGISQQYGQGSGAVGQMQNQVGQNAAIAQNQVGNLASVTQANMQGNISNTGQQIGAQGQYNATQAGQQANVNSANAGLASKQMEGQQGMIGGLMNGAGGVMSMGGPAGPAAAALGGGGGAGIAGGGSTIAGPVTALSTAAFAGGGMVEPVADAIAPTVAPVAAPAALPPNAPSSTFGQFLQGWGSSSTGQDPKKDFDPYSANTMGSQSAGSQALNRGFSNFGKGAKAYYDRPVAAANGGLLQTGGKVSAKSPDQKATQGGDSYANDKVKTVLSEGEIVIPRSVTMSKDPVRGSADFVRKVLAKRRAGK